MIGVTPNQNSPVFAKYFRIAVLGKSNTGKTEVVVNLVCNLYFNDYHRIIVIAPNWEDDRYMLAFKKKCEMGGKPLTLIKSYSDNVIKQIEKKIEEEGKKYNTLIIVDDPIGQEGMNAKVNEKSEYNRFIASIKFKKCSFIFITQSYGAGSTVLRNCLDGIILITNLQFKQLKNVYEDFGQSTFGEFKNIYYHYTRKIPNRAKFIIIKAQGDLYEMYHGTVGKGAKITQITEKEMEEVIEMYKNKKKIKDKK